MALMSDEEVANEIARLERELAGRNYKVVDLARPLEEIDAELEDESDRAFVRYARQHGSQIALISLGPVEFDSSRRS